MKHLNSIQSVTTLGNANELVRVIAQGVLGNEVADTFNGSEISRGVIYNLSQTKFQEAVGKKLGNG